jgi:RNA polymerase sigma-70 factor, ECF subfamily
VEDALIDRARAGDAAAMEALLVEVAPSIERFARRLCSGSDVDDVLQETLLAVVANLNAFEGRAAFTSWVFALTRTACSRQRRGLKNRPHDDDEAVARMPDAAPDPEQRAAGDELSRSLARALEALEPEQREVILLRDIEGLTAPEAAAALGVSAEAIKSRLHRARSALREALRPTLEAAAPPTSARCPDVIALWSKRLEGDLAPADCAEMERHLEGCLACGAACEALKRTLWACQSSRTSAVTPQMRAKVRTALDAWGRARSTMA